ncbi:G1 family glutamic endopeptidase [Kutzneria albida]|uniref:Secreted protein n=1 Tax=Kutzneria albida DSM 43870 TaxID=1449976 RepID=W5W9M5_9PSEU|nr:G1 family glutamic endopeptidase [Kutzneria albida]AHH97828.1 hypothetical protein KALB_4466 [Kutzneria albida DSM 43870]
MAATLGSVALLVLASAAPAVDNGMWAGYVAYSGHYAQISAEWTEPEVTCAPGERSAASFWIGLDGYGTPDLEQLGTAVDCEAGRPRYSAWYEWFPAAATPLTEPVAPGDHFQALITVGEDRTFVMTLRNTTQRWEHTVSKRVPEAPLSSAEVVSEAPMVGTQLPLADFGQVGFAGISVNHAPLDRVTHGRTEIQLGGGGPKTETTDLRYGTEFSTRWLGH